MYADSWNPRLRLLDAMALGDGYFAVTLRTPASLVGRMVADLELLDRYQAHLLAIKPAAEKSAPFLPDASYALASDDVLVVMGEETKLIELHQKVK